MEPGSRWRHYKGKFYTMIALCRLEATGEPHVVYKEGEGEYGEYWCRPLCEWSEEVAPGQKRFTLMQP